MIVNVLYFNARWASPFSSRATVDEVFELSPGRTVKVPFMRRRVFTEHSLSDGCRAVALGYEGGDFSMSVIVPEERCALADLERRLSVGGDRR
jgi:serpin B